MGLDAEMSVQWNGFDFSVEEIIDWLEWTEMSSGHFERIELNYLSNCSCFVKHPSRVGQELKPSWI